jgi:serine phosphatase RsbU (regulator of sigma subunit)
MMCAPLVTRDEVLGIIHLDTTRQGTKFSQDDLELLSGVAAQTALAIASAKMHQRLLRQDRMERDLKVATQVQTSFLPASTPEVEGMEFAAFYRAALDIGGDLYDFVPQPDGGMMIVVGDVAGKGVPAALLMARMSSDVRFYSVQNRDPSEVLPQLSARMDETGMSDTFVTMVLIRADPETREMLIANAGHCDPLVRRAADGDVIRVGGEPGFPLGIMPSFEYEQASYALEPGDVVCLVSDGITEAMDAEKNQYGEDRLIATVEAAPGSAEGVLQAILADVQEHVGDTPQSDDLTCVCFGVNAE